jgi:hypothetical protein
MKTEIESTDIEIMSATIADLEAENKILKWNIYGLIQNNNASRFRIEKIYGDGKVIIGFRVIREEDGVVTANYMF